MRWVAKNVVAAGLADPVRDAVATPSAGPSRSASSSSASEPSTYAGVDQDAVLAVFDLRPAAIIRDLELLRPIYAQTASYGHFGREEPDFSWERTDKADALRAAAGL